MGFFNKRVAVSTDETAIDELLRRGVENVIPKELARKKLNSGERLRVYLGIDPTGAKLHLGHSVPLRKLREFANLGHEVVFLVGSFTATIGDPTGRDAAREPLTLKQVEENFKDYKRQAQKILDFSKIEVRYNGEWLAPLRFADIVKLASNYTVGQLIQRDMFQKRIADGKPISLHEFLYPLMVGYDSVVLDVDCELGGSDQEFNMLSGRHLQERLGKREKFVLTTRLIEGLDGRKMSKTYENCVYLEDEPSIMYGKIMAVKDELVRVYFETTTDVPMAEVDEILRGHPKDAKMRLAREIVSMYHDDAAAQGAQDDWVNTFSKGGAPEEIQELKFGRGIPWYSLLLSEQMLAVVGVSKTEMRRLIEQKAISEVGGEKITDTNANFEKPATLRIGKHRFVKIDFL